MRVSKLTLNLIRNTKYSVAKARNSFVCHSERLYKTLTFNVIVTFSERSENTLVYELYDLSFCV